ncbi:GIY-YIG nuclease family protein [Roseibium sp.]|uniref:GIY-YIG nuclease family protein n=1 Tax=Roseibium sp. TaxID=1936156 RepID=UPI003A9764F8
MPEAAEEIAKKLGGGLIICADEIDRLPATAGSYGLVIELSDRLHLDLPRLGSPTLSPGLYLYCGSAKGPGGLRARVGRHLRQDKTCRWHIDRVTSACAHVAAFWISSGSECQLRSHAAAVFDTNVPIEGFGSSDCKSCPAHFLMLQRQSRIVQRIVKSNV